MVPSFDFLYLAMWLSAAFASAVTLFFLAAVGPDFIGWRRTDRR
jgi:hypothetical protein